MKRGRSFVAVLASLIAIPAAAAADTPAVERARALFFEARGLMRSEQYSEACPKLEESQSLDPGMGTEFNLADCHEHIGRLASALAHFEHVVVTSHEAGQDRHEALARQRVEALTPRVPTVFVEVPRVAGIEVMRGDEAIPTGRAVRVEAGDYVVTARAPEHRPWSTTIHVVAGDQLTVKVPELEEIPRPVTPPPAPPAPIREHDNTQRNIAFGLGGVGAAALVTGGIFGLLSLSAHDDAQRWCSDVTNGCTSQKGVDARETAFDRGNVATVFFIAGGALLAGAATLWVTAPRAKRALRGEF